MNDPNNTSKSRFAATTAQYTFSHVFAPETTQEQLFKKTTFPLIQDVLNGRNSLLFAYGVTNSGKTYSIQGGSTEQEAGIIPRTMDVLFSSIDGLHSNAPYHPERLSGVYEGPSALAESPLERPSTLRTEHGSLTDAICKFAGDIDGLILLQIIDFSRLIVFLVYFSSGEGLSILCVDIICRDIQ